MRTATAAKYSHIAQKGWGEVKTVSPGGGYFSHPNQGQTTVGSLTRCRRNQFPSPVNVTVQHKPTYRTQGPRPEGINTFPKPHQTGTTDPTMASRRSEEFSVPVDTMFVADVVAEHERLMHEPKRRMDLEELVGDDSPGSSDVDKLAAIGPQVIRAGGRELGDKCAILLLSDCAWFMRSRHI